MMSLEERLQLDALNNGTFDILLHISEELAIRLKKKSEKSTIASIELELSNSGIGMMELLPPFRFVDKQKRGISQRDIAFYQNNVRYNTDTFISSILRTTEQYNNAYLDAVANAASSEVRLIEGDRARCEKKAAYSKSLPLKIWSAVGNRFTNSSQNEEALENIDRYSQSLLTWSVLSEASQRFIEDLQVFQMYFRNIKRRDVASKIDAIIGFYRQIANISSNVMVKIQDFLKFYESFCTTAGISFEMRDTTSLKDNILRVTYQSAVEVPAHLFGIKVAGK